MKKIETTIIVFIIFILLCSCSRTNGNTNGLDFSEPENYIDKNINDTNIVNLFNSISSTPEILYDDSDKSIVYYVFQNEGISFCFFNDYLFEIIFNITNIENINPKYQLPYEIEKIINKNDLYKKMVYYPLFALDSDGSEIDVYFFPSYNLIFSYKDEKIERIIINSLFLDQKQVDLDFNKVFLSLSDMKQIFSYMDNVQQIENPDIENNHRIWELIDNENKSHSYLLLGIYTFNDNDEAERYLNDVLKEAAIQIGEKEFRVDNNPFLESLNYYLFIGENDNGTSLISHYSTQFQNLVFSIDSNCPRDLGDDYCREILFSTMFYQMQLIIKNCSS